ncbi:MAG: hypothetical protein ACT4QB_06930 [Gammaproteobacteria bacterium]
MREELAIGPERARIAFEPSGKRLLDGAFRRAAYPDRVEVPPDLRFELARFGPRSSASSRSDNSLSPEADIHRPSGTTFSDGHSRGRALLSLLI